MRYNEIALGVGTARRDSPRVIGTAFALLLVLHAPGFSEQTTAALAPPPEQLETVDDAWRAKPAVTFRSNQLDYSRDHRGNQIPDFSSCGYQAADRSIPFVPAKVKVDSGNGDDTERIQRAIDYVAGLPVHETGFRGAILLEPGEFQVDRTIHVRASGVVLRGSGAGAGGTTIRATGSDRRTLIRVVGTGARVPIGPSRTIVDAYVPVGARRLTLQDTLGLEVGDLVIVTRPSTERWIQTIGCDVEGVGWRAGSRDIRWERVIKRMEDDSIEIDAPITTALDRQFGGGALQSYEWHDRLQQVGIEDLALVSDHRGENPRDEEHAWFGITMQNVANAWARCVEFRHFAGGAVLLEDGTSRITVQDCVSLEPVSEVGGYRRHTFFTCGQQSLFLRCWSECGDHDFGVGHCAPGPNAFVNCHANNALGDSGPLESWASGVLYDNVRIVGADLRLGNRWASPPKTGWSAANCVLWQCQAAHVECFRPPTAENWAIGIWATPAGDGVIQELSDFVHPLSLYQQQLRERLGDQAANAVDPFLLKPVSATSPTLAEAARFVEQSSAPGSQLIDVIREQWKAVATRVEPNLPTAPPNLAEAHVAAPSRALRRENGWLAVESQLKTGGHLTPIWWRGSMIPDKARSFGPAITRYVPGRTGTGLTDDLQQVAEEMRLNHVASYDHHYGLWYDRRRDDHLLVRRSNGDVAPPFYEQPFARTGQGTAWDGLSRYDLTKYHPWYWNRLREFAQICEQHGLIFFHQNYFQHNILEAGAHWVDSPWRPANNVNETGLPEPPPFIGDKRIFVAHLFYDVTEPRRREFHRQFIRQCLNNFVGRTNVIQLTSEEYTGPLSFMQFWLDTIIEWKRETGQAVLVGLSCTKDVQDAILADPVRNPHVDVIDIRYWTYTRDNELYAPRGGQHLSPRQHLRQDSPAPASFASILRAVREYRTKYPQKAVTYYADLNCRGGRDGWAVLMGGGSLPNLPVLPEELAAAILRCQPSDRLRLGPQQWSLGNGDREFLIYSAERESPAAIQLPADYEYEFVNIDPETGQTCGAFQRIAVGQLTISEPRTVIWVRR